MGNAGSTSSYERFADSDVKTLRKEHLNREEETEFITNMVNGCETQIVFADGTSLPCTVIYDLHDDCLHMIVNEKRRVIPLSDLHEILEPDNVTGLTDVEQSMIINPRIVGFRLSSTKKAILLRFSDIRDSLGFYHFLKEIIDENVEQKDEDESERDEEPPATDGSQSSSQTVII